MKNPLFLLFTLLFSCNLDIPLEDEVSGFHQLKKVEALEELLSDAYANVTYRQPLFSLLGGGFVLNEFGQNENHIQSLFEWDKQKIGQETTSSIIWTQHYRLISSANVLLHALNHNGIGELAAEHDVKLQHLKAEAFGLKAYAYLQLVQLFSESYQPASEQLGAVLKSSHKFEVSRARSTLKQTYERIETLLKQAEQLLAPLATTQYVQSSMNLLAVKTLLVRTYLLTQQYHKAAVVAQEALKIQSLEESSTISYKQAFQAEDLATGNPEIIWQLGAPLVPLSTVTVPNLKYGVLYPDHQVVDVLSPRSVFAFDNSDMRYGIALLPSRLKNAGKPMQVLGKYRKSEFVAGDFYPCLIRTAELYFLLAEAQAGAGELKEATTSLNNFLTLRNPAYKPEQDVDEKRFMQRMLFEKQQEFLGEGLVYFDYKRLGQSLFKYDDAGRVALEIRASDPRWVWPLPKQEILQSQGKIKQNNGWN